jgi:hypothetical protein
MHMPIHGKIICLASVLLACGVPSISLAGKCAGTNINNTMAWEPNEIAKGTTLAIFRATSVTVGDDQSAIYHLVSGECVGSFLTTPDGTTQGSGSCARKDKDGDVLNEEWMTVGGTGGKGTWKHVGGTGKFAGARNTGQWEFNALQGKMAAVRWTGNCQ